MNTLATTMYTSSRKHCANKYMHGRVSISLYNSPRCRSGTYLKMNSVIISYISNERKCRCLERPRHADSRRLRPVRVAATHAYGLWAMWSSPLIISADIRPGRMSAFSKRLLLDRNLIRINQDALGRQATRLLDSPALNLRII